MTTSCSGSPASVFGKVGPLADMREVVLDELGRLF